MSTIIVPSVFSGLPVPPASSAAKSVGYSYPDLKAFISELRRYEKDSLIEAGRRVIWGELRRCLSYRGEEISSFLEPYQMAQTYGPYVLSLTLATANNQRLLKADDEAFRHLCYGYRDIEQSIFNKEFLKKEQDDVLKLLKSSSLGKYVTGREKEFETWSLSGMLFETRLASIQNNYTKNERVYDFYGDAEVFLRLDKALGGLISHILRTELGLELTQVLYAVSVCGKIACASAGLLGFEDKTSISGYIKPKSALTIYDIKKVVSCFSIKESSLRAGWLEGKILRESSYYQPYYPLPTYNKIAIELDKAKQKGQFIVLDLDLFMRGFREALSSFIFEKAPKAERGSIGSAIGGVIETYIYDALCSIFGSDKVKRLDDESTLAGNKHADIVIELKKAILLIEIKTGIGENDALSVIRPKDAVKIWERLYDACQQCAASTKHLRSEGTTKPIIPLVIVSTHFTEQVETFKQFSEGFGVYKTLGLPEVNILSWSEFERILRFSSLKEFEDFLAKNNKLPSEYLGGNPLMHNFGYLDCVKAMPS